MSAYRVVQVGLGPIGSAVARHVVDRVGLDLVGGVDIDPDKAGLDVGLVIGLDRSLGFPVTTSLAGTLARTEADVAVHTTGSYLDQIKPQIVAILESGLDVVSTAEELSFPWWDHPKAAAEIDAAARRAGKTVLGTGVNPGFLMDALPLTLTAICQRVDHIAITRVINASTRRGPFQTKIGAGMLVEAFRSKMDAGRLGHVGLPESMAMLFDTLGRKLVCYESEVEPIVADRHMETEHVDVQPGQVMGLRQTARGYAVEGEFAALTFEAALNAENEGDSIVISGRPNLEVTLKGSNGDVATAAIAVNSVRRVVEAGPGLVTMRDLPLVARW
jgi:4-hydroxy-tetrahydrodipicolinate reductase